MDDQNKPSSVMQDSFADAYGSAKRGTDAIKTLLSIALNTSQNDPFAAASLLMLTASYLMQEATKDMPRLYTDEQVRTFLEDGSPNDMRAYIDLASRVQLVGIMRAKQEQIASSGQSGNA